MRVCLSRRTAAGIGVWPMSVCEEEMSDKALQHQTENHDPIAALRKERGEKIVCRSSSFRHHGRLSDMFV